MSDDMVVTSAKSEEMLKLANEQYAIWVEELSKFMLATYKKMDGEGKIVLPSSLVEALIETGTRILLAHFGHKMAAAKMQEAAMYIQLNGDKMEEEIKKFVDTVSDEVIKKHGIALDKTLDSATYGDKKVVH